ncbi:helix-turn-helix domain-containing protein [Streptomonospora wellingtoniae]|uniref:Helix-turn-helix transcriptional regulator n=1 Tax=Streptomonospora wellingtoniae TaxID=3075544 RepID=A0ABU2KWB5_9ACTN|nr:helix-turn-helix transcriptional regulator [Streptomonospora sp. DSM 45055]MDT0303552.1 helix-turn-helix transcriptional regulator [Streptomonospora sp. DSM 45055]
MVEKVHSTWARFGAEVRRSRRIAGGSQDQLAKSINISPAMMSSLERGTRTPKREHAEAIDAVLNTGGSLSRLWVNLMNQEDVPEWFREVVVLERQATEIREYQMALVPGLVQTADYARAVLRSGRPWYRDAEVDRLVESRMNRSDILAKDDRPLFWTVLDEVVVRRVVGDDQAMRGQLAHLLKLIGDQQIQLQLVPHETRCHPGLSGPFRVMAFHGRPTVAYAEHAMGGELIDDEDQVRESTTIFGALQAEAMSPTASADLIRVILGELDA